MITDFHAKGYEFLSNFYPVPIGYEGKEYKSVEHAYQAAKTLDLVERERIRACFTAAQAKKAGKTVKVRTNWDEIKIDVMRQLLEQKFNQNPMKQWLIATRGSVLIEANHWNDTFWGVCRGKGENHLGKLLMQIRTTLS
jgi:hypothetical protein